MKSDQNSLYRKLPAVGELLDREDVARFSPAFSRSLVAEAARTALSRVREEIRRGAHDDDSIQERVADLPHALNRLLQARVRPSLRRVINATGVILQTNMGRAPLSREALDRVLEVAGGYCNLEMQVETGERARRDMHVEQLILDVLTQRTGERAGDVKSERAACVVNNCAGATFLALNTLAEGGEVIVSRGELVEIGGGFRVPDILRKSGALLREVGTTNKTRLRDYAEAISPQTRLILRVHQSNFRIEGFTERLTLEQLVQLGNEHGIPVFEDQGTGCIVALTEAHVNEESSWVRSVASGAALIAASGDKLLGGPQCGLLVGTVEYIERLRANPLFRALRVDKFTYAALEATLLAYLQGKEGALPVIAMLRLPAEAIEQRCTRWVEVLGSDHVSAELQATQSVVGGGTTPGAVLPSFAVALRHREMNESALAALLRSLDPPVVSRISEGRVLLDLRTVAAEDDAEILALLSRALGREQPASVFADGDAP
jgi:L-seryl-tRNA(Ser) seleniumtransferase